MTSKTRLPNEGMNMRAARNSTNTTTIEIANALTIIEFDCLSWKSDLLSPLPRLNPVSRRKSSLSLIADEVVLAFIC